MTGGRSWLRRSLWVLVVADQDDASHPQAARYASIVLTLNHPAVEGNIPHNALFGGTKRRFLLLRFR